MNTTFKRDVFFSFFMFTADLRPQDSRYTKSLIDHLKALIDMGYSAARSVFEDLLEYAAAQEVKLAIEPVKSWETPPPNMVSEILDFLDGLEHPQGGVTIDTAQVVMESQGPLVFKDNVARAARQ